MKRILGVLIAGAMALTPSLASAMPRVSAGIMQSHGTNSYAGTNVFAAIGTERWSIAPEYRTFDVDGLGKRLHAFSARAGWDFPWLGAGVGGGMTSRTGDYRASWASADLAVTLSPGGESGIRRIGGPGRGGAPVGKGIARVDFGGGVTFTRHEKDNFEANLDQNEIHAFLGASVLGILVSGRASKWNYSTDLRTAGILPPATWTPIVGHVPLTNSFFPKRSVHLNVEVPFFPMFRPFAGFTQTSFEDLSGLTPGDTNAYAAGLRVGLEMVALEASYQHIVRTGAAKELNFVQFGATLRL